MDSTVPVSTVVSLYPQRHATQGHDYAGDEQAFIGGEAAVLINGTWVVDSYHTQAMNKRTALQRYAPHTPPQLFAVPAAWTDSHVWVVPRQEHHDDRRYRAAVAFLAFLFDHSDSWVRTGHIPTRQSVLDSRALRGWLASRSPREALCRAQQEVGRILSKGR